MSKDSLAIISGSVFVTSNHCGDIQPITELETPQKELNFTLEGVPYRGNKFTV